jgi:peroxiredoxin
MLLRLGSKAPEFDLTDAVSGRRVTLDSMRGEQALLVMFICRHCPYVVHVKEELARLGSDYVAKSLAIVAISSNDAQNYPDDAPQELARFAKAEGFNFPLCYDETQDVAKAFTAAYTPDFFLFDKAGRLAYRGQLDDSRPGNGKPVTGKDLRAALDAVLAGRAPSPDQRPSAGCNIKWKPGGEPEYFK